MRRDANFLDFKELLSWLLQQHDKVEVFVMTTWLIWTQRNQVRLHLAAASLHQILHLANDRFAKFLAYQPTTTDRHVILRTRWQPPPSDFMKINFDGAVFSSENKSGIGMVIRNSADLVMASCS